MRTRILLSIMLFAAYVANGQSQKAIKLTDDNVNVHKGLVHEHSASTSGVQSPATGNNKTWDYSNLTGGAQLNHAYGANKQKAYSKTAILDTGLTEYFTPYETFPTNNVYDEDEKGYFFAGTYTPRNATYLETGDLNDSLIISNQSSVLTHRDNILAFPATKGSTWNSSYSKTVNFNLTLEFAGYFNAKSSEVAYSTVYDSVVGWGDLKIPTCVKNKKCREFDALLVRRQVTTYDSIFINGKPAPEWLCEAFGTTQGAKTISSYTESFYAENNFRPAITFNYGTDKNYKNLVGIVYSQDKQGDGDDEFILANKGQAQESPVSLPEGTTSMTNRLFNNGFAKDFTMYPNPVANGADINCRFTKNAGGNWNLYVHNAMGQVVKTITVSGTGLMNIPVQLGSNNNAGLYSVNVVTENGQSAANAKFIMGNK